MVLRLFAAFLLVLSAGNVWAGKPNWHLYFCLPYDNDLAVHSDFIQSEIASHVSSNKVEVTLLVQLPGKGIEFKHISADTVVTQLSEHEEFFHGKALEEFLLWSEARVKEKKRKAFFMLGHGGGVNKIALEASRDSTWTSTRVFADVLGHHLQLHDSQSFDFLFLQQCVKATVADYYELEHVADWIVASPLPIGAPNYYYASVLDSLSVGELKRPRQLIDACINEDKLEMSEVWSIIDAERFANWLRYLNRYPPKLEAQHVEKGTPLEYDAAFFGRPNAIHYAGETYWELEDWLAFQHTRGYWDGTSYGEVYSGYLRAVDTIDRFAALEKQLVLSPMVPKRRGPKISGVVIRGALNGPEDDLRLFKECPNLIPFLKPLEQWPE